MKETIGVISLGCAKNQVNAEQMMYLLQEAGYQIQENVLDADVAIINTCGFIESAQAEAISHILQCGELKKAGKIGKILVTGCLSQRYQEEILKEMHILNMNACISWPKAEDEYLTKNSVQFHEHMGFHLAGEFHDSGYKFGRWYNVVWMEKMIGDHPEKPKPVRTFPEIREKFAGNLLES